MEGKVKVEGIAVPQWYLEAEPQLLEAIEACAVAEERLKGIKQRIFDMMDSEGIAAISSGLTEVHLCRPTTVETIDKERLRKDMPGIFEKYATTSQRKGYVAVKLT